jgi:hypothetical protein
MSSSQYQNQFAQTPLLGQPDLSYSFNTKSVMIDPESVSTRLQVGQALKLVAGATPMILADECGSTTQPYGVIHSVNKKNVYTKGQVVEIACKGNVIYLEAAAAILRNAVVENVPAASGGPKVQTKASGARLGIALDQASGAGELIRIEIDPGAV